MSEQDMIFTAILALVCAGLGYWMGHTDGIRYSHDIHKTVLDLERAEHKDELERVRNDKPHTTDK